MKKNGSRLLTVVALVLLAGLLFEVETNREYAISAPQEGETKATKLLAGNLYEQAITTTGHKINAVSLYLRPAIATPAKLGTLSVVLKDNSQIVARGEINVSFIDQDGSTRVTFSAPSKGTKRQLTLAISVPKSLSGHYRAQWADRGDNFTGEGTAFFINGVQQEQSLAWRAASVYRPPLAYQAGIFLLGLAGLVGAKHWLNYKTKQVGYVVALSLAYLSPRFVLGDWPLLLGVVFVISFTGMYLFLRQLNLRLLPALMGANIFALTTYFPLQIIEGRLKLALFACLPYLLMLSYPTGRSRLKNKVGYLIGLTILIVTLGLILPYKGSSTSPLPPARWRDIWLDANQVITSNESAPAYFVLRIPRFDPKTITNNGGWGNFGSYIGLIGLILALLGLVSRGRQHWRLVLMTAAAIAVAATSWLTPLLAAVSPLPPQYFIVVATCGLAALAALGTDSLWRFLGPGRLPKWLVCALIVVVLIDLLNVSSKTLQFGLF